MIAKKGKGDLGRCSAPATPGKSSNALGETTLATAVLLLVAAVPTATPDTAAVRAVLDTQLAAWNRGPRAFMETYWKSEDLVFQSNASTTRGWQATWSVIASATGRKARRWGSSASRSRHRALAPGIAFARGAFRLAFRDGKTAQGRFTLLLRRRPEGWRIVYDHSSAGD